MKKFQERLQSDSCWNKAKDEEYVFVLLERDATMASTIEYWCTMRVDMGLNTWEDEKIVSAMDLVNYLRGKQSGQARNNPAVPDPDKSE
jgi:hypothetical protein